MAAPLTVILQLTDQSHVAKACQYHADRDLNVFPPEMGSEARDHRSACWRHAPHIHASTAASHHLYIRLLIRHKLIFKNLRVQAVEMTEATCTVHKGRRLLQLNNCSGTSSDVVRWFNASLLRRYASRVFIFDHPPVADWVRQLLISMAVPACYDVRNRGHNKPCTHS